MKELPYKLLIADDEYWSREKLAKMIDWNEYGLKLLPSAANGEEVLAQIERECPDILITDINMPFIDGVELVQTIKKTHPEIIFFVVSGYDDYEYVRTTMKAGAVNYLLKPVSKTDLVEAISEALQVLYEKQSAIEMETERQKSLELASSWIYDREFSMLIDKENDVFSGSIPLKLDVSGYTLILLKIHDMKSLPEGFYDGMLGFSYSLKKKLREWIGDESAYIFNHISKPNEFLIISDRSNSWLYKVSMKCLHMMEQLIDSPVSLILSDHCYTLNSIHSAYVQNISLLMGRKFEHRSCIIVYNEEQKTYQKEHITNKIDSKYEDMIQLFCEQRNRKRLKNLIAQKLDVRTDRNHSCTYLDISQMLKQINGHIIRGYCKNSDAKYIIDIENMSDYVEQAVDRLDAKLLWELEEDFVDTVLQMSEGTEQKDMKTIAKQVRQYIDAHYVEELTLTELAKQYGAEKTYLSKIFHQETGTNLMTYIAEKRMEQGRKLIREGKVSLTEVSYLVGYNDYTYFNRVFRKICGMSPSEYRNICQEDDG